MDITAPWKLAALGVVAVGLITYLIVAMVTGKGDTNQAWLILSAISFYLIGNGTGARKGFVSVPPFQPKPTRQLEILAKIAEEDLPFKERERVERLVARTREAEGDA